MSGGPDARQLGGHVRGNPDFHAEIRRSVQVRMPATPDELLALAAAYAAVGVTDLLLVLHAADPVAQAEQAGELLPRLRAAA